MRACVHRAHVRIARDFGTFRLCTKVCLKVEAFLVERVCVFGGGVGVLVGTRIQDCDGVTTDRTTDHANSFIFIFFKHISDMAEKRMI